MRPSWNFLKFFLILLFPFFKTVIACKVESLDYISNATSTEFHQFFAYDLLRVKSEIPYASIHSCKETALNRKYLMIALGAQVVGQTDNEVGTIFNNDYRPNNCQISNSLITTTQTPEKKEEAFLKKSKYLKSCIEVYVSDMGRRPIEYPPVQLNCHITQISEHEVKFSGGHCFFKPHFDSIFSVSIKTNDSCLDLHDLASQGIDPLDLSANLNFYTGGDSTGTSIDLMAIESIQLRISVNPPKDILPVSDNLGLVRPVFPSLWQLRDLDFGEIRIKGQGKHDMITTSLIVSHVCNKKCKNGICLSPCDYALPVSAEFTLYKKNENGKKEFLANWYDGGVASSQWEGFIEGIGYKIDHSLIQEGENYELEANFRDPKIDFNLFKGRIKDKIGLINTRLGVLNRDGYINEISDVREIKVLDRAPQIPEIRDLSFQRSLNGVSDAIARFQSFFSTTFWPPEYEKSCGPRGCRAPGDTHISLKANFKIKKTSEKGTFRSYELENLIVSRKSPILGNREDQILTRPEIVCEKGDFEEW